MEIVKRKNIFFFGLYFSVLINPSNAQFKELVLAAAESDLLLSHGLQRLYGFFPFLHCFKEKMQKPHLLLTYFLSHI